MVDKIIFLDLQVAFFFSDILKGPHSSLAMKINSTLPDLFDEMPFMLPTNENAPIQIPLFELTSASKQYRCTASKQRIDLFYNVPKEQRALDFFQHKKSFVDKVRKFFLSIYKWPNIGHITRIGYIATFFAPHESPTKHLINIFVKDGKLDTQTTELNIRYNQRMQKDSFELNTITKLDPGVISDTNEKGIVIQKDINTVAEIPFTFDEVLFDRFLNTAESFLTSEHILKVVN